MRVKLYNQSAKEVGTVELPESVFGMPWNADLVHQVVTSQAANLRSPVAHAKGRGEVRGGGRKPWKQKGTGRARHGSIRSPLWRGGGVTHGPTKEKIYKKKINKKMAQLALYTAFSAKARDGEIIVVDDLKLKEPKTKLAAEVFKNFSKIKSYSDITKKKNRILVVLADNNIELKRSLRNLPFLNTEEVRNLNAVQVLGFKYLLFIQPSIEKFK